MSPVDACATVSTCTVSPALNIFHNLLERWNMYATRKLSDGSRLQFEKIYPLDAAYDTLADAPEDIRGNKRYKDVGDFSVSGVRQRLVADFGEPCPGLVGDSLANGPQVKQPLLGASRGGCLTPLT